MQERKSKVLHTLVRTHISSAKPVSSSAIIKQGQLQISPATVRHIVHALDAAGFVFQPHTSAGRLPTDMGYRSYVDHLKTSELAQVLRSQIIEYFGKSDNQSPQGMKDLADFLANQTESYVAIGNMQTGSVTQAGVSNIIHASTQVDEKVAIMEELSEVIDNVSDIVIKASKTISDQPEVYIGQENPFMNSEHLSIIIGTTTLANGQIGLIVLVGPKRMTYQRNISLLSELMNKP